MIICLTANFPIFSPRQFYAIHTYLMCGDRLTAPHYEFIAMKVGEALRDITGQSAEAVSVGTQPAAAAISGIQSTLGGTQRSTATGVRTTRRRSMMRDMSSSATFGGASSPSLRSDLRPAVSVAKPTTTAQAVDSALFSDR